MVVLPMKRWTATNSEGYVAPVALAVDAVVLTVRDGALRVLVTEREDGSLALPGGFVGPSESPERTVRRKLAEKTGLTDVYLEQLATFGEPGRDPRGWIPTVAYLALVPPTTEPRDPAARWVTPRARRRLAFDHGRILETALDRVRGKLWWSNIAVGVLPDGFTMSEAREVYGAISGRSTDPATFARDLKATGLIEPTGEQRRGGRGRPAAAYRFRTLAPEWGAGRRKRIEAS
jgi:8-oxo-dGTP diphosphatase